MTACAFDRVPLPVCFLLQLTETGGEGLEKLLLVGDSFFLLGNPPVLVFSVFTCACATPPTSSASVMVPTWMTAFVAIFMTSFLRDFSFAEQAAPSCTLVTITTPTFKTEAPRLRLFFSVYQEERSASLLKEIKSQNELIVGSLTYNNLSTC